MDNNQKTYSNEQKNKYKETQQYQKIKNSIMAIIKEIQQQIIILNKIIEEKK